DRRAQSADNAAEILSQRDFEIHEGVGWAVPTNPTTVGIAHPTNMPLNVYYDEFQPSWEEEGLFARDINGQLIRVVEASEQDYFQQVTVTIDGQAIRVPR